MAFNCKMQFSLLCAVIMISTALAVCTAAPAPIASAIDLREYSFLAEHVPYHHLENICCLNYQNVSVLYAKELETEQSINDLLTFHMAPRLGLRSSIPPPHAPCFIPARSSESLTGFDIEERLTEDLFMLANLTEVLQSATEYESDKLGGQYTRELLSIQERHLHVVEALYNITGVPAVGSGVMLETTPDEVEPSSSSSNELTLVSRSGTNSDRCNGDLTAMYQYVNLYELYQAYRYTQLDLNEIHKQLSPH